MTIRTYLLLMGVGVILLTAAEGVTATGSTTAVARSARFAELATERQPPTPTPDRLAPPPTVASPTQADTGAQLYWLNCQPCHGDRGQGLTDEWRDQYPPEDRNCWDSGCHGERPYENGFKLPATVPALIGGNSLARFESLGQVHAFIRAAMPFQAPGSLTDAEYLSITAFLGRERGVWSGAQPLPSAAGSDAVRLRPAPIDGAAIATGMGGLIAALIAVAWIVRRRSSARR